MPGWLKAAAYVAVISAFAFLLVISSSRDTNATTWNAEYSTTLTNTAAFAAGDSNAIYDQDGPNANFSQVVNPASATGFQPVTDFQLPDGANVGQIASQTTLGFINGPCSTGLLLKFNFMDSTTDVTDTVDMEGTGDDLVRDDDLDGNVEAEDTNGIPTYADHYPSYLNATFDPDGAILTKKPIRPRARYASHLQVLAGAPVTHLQFVIFNPGDLGDAAKGLAGYASAFEEAFGYPLYVVLNNPTAAAAPSTISDFCTTLGTNTTLYASTKGLIAVKAGVPPWETDGFVQQCRSNSNSLASLLGNDNDADGVTDDGCLYVPDPCVSVDYSGDTTVSAAQGEDEPPASNEDGDGTTDEGCFLARGENPAPLTGLYGTGTHVVRSYSSSIRDQDGDNKDSGLDVCPVNADNNVDADGDGLDSACDPNDAVASAGAPAPNGVDNDGDTATDEDPVDNADNDNDNRLDEDGECKGTSGPPDQDQDCYLNRGDNCALLANNNSDLDANPAPADKGPPTDSIGDACEAGGNAPVAELVAQCNNQLDEDGDTYVNDGCASSGTRPEVGAECQDRGIDSDGDAVRNDGCPAAGGGLANGHYHSNGPLGYLCIPDPNGADDSDGNANSDNDGDGICDSTEDLLGSDKGNVGSKPEYLGLEYSGLAADQNGDTVVDVSPQICNDQSLYPAGATIDNDGTEGANAADPGCANIASDTDDDGVPDAADNCMSDDNPEQQDSDGDGSGDDCDGDQDGDGIDGTIESGMGTDPTDNCADDATDDANPSDNDRDADLDIGDVIALFNGIIGVPANYRLRSDFDQDRDVDVGDVIIGFGNGRIGTRCDGPVLATPPSVTPGYFELHNDTGGAINDIHLELTSKVIHPYKDSVKITESPSCGTGTWSFTVSGNVVDATRSTNTCPNSTTLTVKINARRPPVLRCFDWTLNGAVVNSSPAPCRLHNTTGGNVDNLYKFYGNPIIGPLQPWEFLVCPGVTVTNIPRNINVWFAEYDFEFSAPIPNSTTCIERQGMRWRAWSVPFWAWTDTTRNEDGGAAGDCNDNVDNGGDGRTDSFDPDCQLLAFAHKVNAAYKAGNNEDGGAGGDCGDTVDNGPDGAADGDDSDCYGRYDATNVEDTGAAVGSCGNGRSDVATEDDDPVAGGVQSRADLQDPQCYD